MRSLLVTGGAGFIGANFVHYWAAQYPDDRIVVLDALTYAGNQASLESISGNPLYRFVHGDIGDSELVRRLLADEQTVLAGQSGVGKSSLLNALEPTLGLRVGAVSADSRKGTHTTRSANLLRLGFGGWVVATPGYVGVLGLWPTL